MGQRANLIIVENGEYTLRYDHWVANRLDDILFWGVKYALKYFEAQEIVGEDGWLDDIWAEGGAVIDLDKKHLLWYGGEDLLYDILLRRTFLRLQQKVWQGWEIEWAHRGIVDFAEYVGVPKQKVLADRAGTEITVEIALPEQKSWLSIIGSVQFANDEIRIFPLQADVDNYLRNGIDLIEQCRNAQGLETLVWNEWSDSEGFPTGGFHLDEKKKTVEFWQARNCTDEINEFKRLWSDWDVVWLRDNYEFQIKRLNGKVVLPQINENDLIETLRTNLLQEDNKSGVESFLDVKEILEKENKSVEINQWALKSHHVDNPLEIKKRIWETCFSD